MQPFLKTNDPNGENTIHVAPMAKIKPKNMLDKTDLALQAKISEEEQVELNILLM